MRVTSVTLVCPPPPPANNAVITLTRDVMHDLLEGVSDDVITVSRDLYGYFALYTCITGSVFTEGGTVRTLVCTDGNWLPDSVPGCHGNRILLTHLLRQENSVTDYLTTQRKEF